MIVYTKDKLVMQAKEQAEQDMRQELGERYIDAEQYSICMSSFTLKNDENNI